MVSSLLTVILRLNIPFGLDLGSTTRLPRRLRPSENMAEILMQPGRPGDFFLVRVRETPYGCAGSVPIEQLLISTGLRGFRPANMWELIAWDLVTRVYDEDDDDPGVLALGSPFNSRPYDAGKVGQIQTSFPVIHVMSPTGGRRHLREHYSYCSMDRPMGRYQRLWSGNSHLLFTRTRVGS